MSESKEKKDKAQDNLEHDLHALQEKRKAFEADPDRFVDIESIVCGVKVEAGGISHFINMKHHRYFSAAIGELILEIPFAKQFAKQKEREREGPGIIVPGDNGKNRLK